MRTFRFFLPLFLSLAVTFLSCKKEERISVSMTMLESDYLGDDITMTVQATSHWTVVANYTVLSAEEIANYQQPVWYRPYGAPSPDNHWIIPDIKEGEGGTTQLIVHIEPSTGNSRMAWLVFRVTADGQVLSVPVYQQGKLDRDMSDKLSPGMKEHLGTEHPTFSSILDIKLLNLNDKSFDFSSDLVYFENLEQLWCQNSGLSAIDVKMPKLESLWMADCKVTRLDPQNFPALQVLDCSGNPLESLDILKAPELQMVSCGRIPVKELSLGPQLHYVDIPECEIERLDLSHAENLEELDCSGNNLKEVDLSATQVYRLDCSNNPQLSSLVLSRVPLMFLDASSCNFSGSFSISSKDLFILDLRNNRLDRLVVDGDVTSCSIYCDNNQLTELVLPHVAVSGGLGLTCTNNLLEEVGVIDPRSFAWNGSNVSMNPGKDNVFTIYVTEQPASWYLGYMLLDWQWQGQGVSVQFVTRL